jgi:AcrR family transcriptional regulator
MPDHSETDVRRSILEAAVQVIEKKGLADVSMREVARIAGVSHQLPYHYFRDREGIFAAVAEHGFDLFSKRLAAIAQSDLASDEKLAAAGRAYVDFACDQPAHFRVMFRNDFVAMDRHPSAGAVSDQCFASITQISKEVAAVMKLTPPDEEALTLAFWSTAHGLACLMLDGPLAAKLPAAAAARVETTRRVMESLRFLVVSASRRRARK